MHFETLYQELAYSTAMTARCDACLRVGGPSAGADEMVGLARRAGKWVVQRFEDIPTG